MPDGTPIGALPGSPASEFAGGSPLYTDGTGALRQRYFGPTMQAVAGMTRREE